MARNETDLQIACARYLDHLPVLWCHVANERQTTMMRGAKLKKMGVKSGVPDILIFEARHNYCGLAVELKFGRNKTTENQNHWLWGLFQRGWQTAVVTNFDEFQKIVDDYLTGPGVIFNFENHQKSQK